MYSPFHTAFVIFLLCVILRLCDSKITVGNFPHLLPYSHLRHFSCTGSVPCNAILSRYHFMFFIHRCSINDPLHMCITSLPQSCLFQVHKYCVGDILAHHGRVWHMVCAVFGSYHHYRWEISRRNLSSVSRFRCDRWKLEGGTRLQRPRVRLCMDHHSNPLNAKLLPCQGRILVGEVHAAAVPIDGHLSGIDPPFLG